MLKLDDENEVLIDMYLGGDYKVTVLISMVLMQFFRFNKSIN